MSPIGSISNNNVSNFNQIDNTPKSNPTTSQQKVSSSNINKTENANPEQLGKGLQDVKSGTKSANETVKTGNEIIKSAVIGVKGNTEQISKKLEVFLPEEKTFRSLKDDISKLDFGAKTIKQGLDTIKRGVQNFEQTINNGKDVFEKLVIGVGIPASKLNQAESKADVSIRITNFGLRSAELGAGQVQQGIQTIELGTKFLGSNQEKGKELIKNGVDTVNRGVDRLAREASQSAKNIDDAASSVINAANDAAKSIGQELPEKPALESQHPGKEYFTEPHTFAASQSQDEFNGCPPINERKNYSHPIAVKDPANPGRPSNIDNNPHPDNSTVNDPANPAVNSDNTIVKDPSNPDSVTVSGTTKTDSPPPPINRENLSTTDKLVIDTLGLDKIKPGEKYTVEASALVKFGAVAYGGLGINAKVSFERDQTDPNKFNVTIKGEPSFEGGVEAKALGEGGGVKKVLNAEVAVNLNIDFSKEGEATEFAFFAAQAGLTAVLPTIATPLLVIENLPGIKLPGEPIDYIKSHITSLEVGAGTSQVIAGELVAALGLGGSAAGKLSGGGRIDFNGDDTYTVTSNISVSGKAETSISGGGPGVAFSTPAVSGELTLSLEGTSQFDKNGEVLDSDVRVKLVARGQVLTGGAEYEFSTSLKNLVDQVPPEVGNRLKEAVLKGNSNKVSEILKNEILPNFNVKFDVKERIFTDTGFNGKIDASIGGFGGELGFGIKKESTVVSSQLKGTLGRDGVIVDTLVEKNGVKTTQRREIKFDDLKKEVSNLVSSTTQSLQDTTNKTVKPRKTLNILNRGLLGNLLG